MVGAGMRFLCWVDREGRARTLAPILLASLAVTAVAATASAAGAARPGGHARPSAAVGPAPVAIALNNTGTFGCQNSSAPFHCYGPTQIRAAYAIQALLDTGRDGRGKTIT